MFGKVISTILYFAGAVTLVIGASIAAIIAIGVPGYLVPVIVGADIMVIGALSRAMLGGTEQHSRGMLA